ncbi:MAG TPA: dihydrolipoamide acetyltransferase family protein [Solirubrobacteraceae bacterium]|nr:dihydrolipoamide acetyltransferase family protein [Solirubrobacteraceae bacterium]
MAEIVMPRLSDTMEEGTILRWLKQDGERVARGEELVEIETDKAAMIYESDQEGTLQLLAAEGETLPVGEVIAHVGEGAVGGEAPVATERADTPEPARPPAPTSASAAPSPGERVKASPLARRIARDREVDLHALSGTGPGGRIVKADVEAAGPAPAPAEPAPPAPDVSKAKGETTTQALNRTQQTIARRMAESKATIPDFTLRSEVEMEACVALRAELKRISKDEAPTYNDMVVKAAALALREHPRANGSYKDGALQLHSRVNVGVAVAAQDALVVPTVFDADEKSLGEIARETRALAARVRDGSITPPELGGGTFTVSNLGMYGVASFTAIVNPPQAAILAVGAVEQRAVVRDEQVVPRQMLSLTLVCDHRILYGADAAEFLARIRELLQTPAALTL